MGVVVARGGMEDSSARSGDCPPTNLEHIRGIWDTMEPDER